MRAITLAMLCPVLGACARDHEGTATFSPTPRELCESIVRCETRITVEECLTEAEPAFERVREAGCVAESNAANACTIEELDSTDGGMCDFVAVEAACDAPYAAYRECVSRGVELSCLSDHGLFEACYTYRGVSLDPETTCDSLAGTIVTTCPDGDIVGTCTNISGEVERTTIYYGPLGAELTAETLAMACTDGGGRWSMP